MNYNINVDIDTVSTSAAGIAKAIQDVEESMKTAQEAANEAKEEHRSMKEIFSDIFLIFSSSLTTSLIKSSKITWNR